MENSRIASQEEYMIGRARIMAETAERNARYAQEYAEAYEQSKVTFEKQLHAPEFRYTRFRPNFGVTIYNYDGQSPTGVHAGATIDMEDARKLLDATGRPFPLSPTEGLNKSGASAY